jgi:hypothetical protein
MVTSCCHGNVKSSDFRLKLLFYIRGTMACAKEETMACAVFFRFKLIK